MGVMIFIALTVILFTFYYIIIIKSYVENKKQWNQAIPVEAKIVSIENEVYEYECCGENDYRDVFSATRCIVSFYVNTIEYVQDAMIEKRKQKLQVGDLVEIRYYYNAKQEIEIVDETKFHKSSGDMLFGVLILAAMLLVLLKSFLSSYK